MATAATDPYTGAYYSDQRQKINDSYQIGLLDSQQKQAQAGLSWQDRIAQLQQTLGNQRQQFGNRFAQRGLLNSGVYNYGSKVGETGGLGALQQFQSDAGRQMNTANSMYADVNNQYGGQQQQLGTVHTNELNSLNNLETADAARQSIANSINGATS